MSKMKLLRVVSLIALAAGLTGCINQGGWPTVRGSGTTLAESRDVAQFDRVSISGAGEVILTQGAEESLVIEADDNLLPYIQAHIENGRLAIGPHNVNVRPTRMIQYKLSVKNLRELHLSGSIRVHAAALQADRLEVRISGSGKMNVDQLQAGTLKAQISGSGSIAAAGRAESQEIRISGSGNHQALELASARAEVRISGSGDASLWVSDTLSAHVSGSGQVEYRGRPSVDSHVSGSGRVRRVGGGH